MPEYIKGGDQMQRRIGASLVILPLGLVIILAGCGGPAPVPVEKPAEKDVSDKTEGVNPPDWFLNLPDNPDSMYSVGTHRSKSMEMALSDAKHAAQAEMASQLELKISAMFKRFSEEVGMGEDAELRTTTTAASKGAMSTVLRGARVAKQAVNQEKGVEQEMYTAYVLMELPVKAMNAAVVGEVKQNTDMYTRFRASEGFKELESEVAKQ
jgi:hypothetical protein